MDLESVGLLKAVTPALPTVKEYLLLLKQELATVPKKVLADPQHFDGFQDRVMAVFRSFDWSRIDASPLAVKPSYDDQFLNALADLLLSLPDGSSFAELTHPARSPWIRSFILCSLPAPKKGPQTREICIAYGPANAPQFVTYKPKDLKTLREDYDHLADSFRKCGIEFLVKYEEFCAEVRPRRGRRKQAS